MMTSIAGGLNTGIWLCAVVLGATGSAIIVTVPRHGKGVQ